MTVEKKQALLKYLGYYDGKVDGLWGPGSEAATREFQKSSGLNADGIFGDNTLAAAKEAVANDRFKPQANPEPLPGVADGSPGGGFWGGVAHFTREEFRCPCGQCGGFPVEPDKALVRALVRIREHFSAPVTIVPLPPADPHSGGSGIRCAAYNATLPGSVPNSRHLRGKAADILVRGFSGTMVKDYCDSLIREGALRYCYVIGGGNSVHVDVL